MSVYSEVAAEVEGMDTEALLKHLILERFPGQTAVTASLRARAVVVLKMVAEIDPDTPVIFCHASDLGEDSHDYRSRLIATLGLTNTTETFGERVTVDPDDADHHECLWWEDPTFGGRVHETIHLNQALAPYACWISAVYHKDKHPTVRQRLDVDGRLIKVDPLVDWTQKDVQRFFKAHDLPRHPRVQGPRPQYVPPREGEEMPTYCF